MKNQLLIPVLAVFLCGSVNGQVETDEIARKKHEINVGFTNLLTSTRTYYEPYYYPLYDALETSLPLSYDSRYIYPPYGNYPIYDQSLFGLGYKFHFGKNAARLSVAFQSNSEETDNNPVNGYLSEYKNTDYLIAVRSGIEHSFLRLRKFDFYLALDGIYRTGEEKQESSSFDYNQGNAYVSKNKMTYQEVGAGLGVGLRFFVHPNLSFSTETHVDYTNRTIKNTNSYTSTGINNYSGESSNKMKGSISNVNPLAILSVNVHF